MKNYGKIYALYTGRFIEFLRFLVFAVLIVVSSFCYYQNQDFLKWPLFLLALFLMKEIFFRFHIYRKKPELSTQKNDGRDIFKSFTLKAAKSYLFFKKFSLGNITKENSVKFMLLKVDIKKEELKQVGINPDDLAKYAFDLVKNLKEDYVTTMDVFASYLLLTEDQTKLLFNKQLKKEELMEILYWAKSAFPKEEGEKIKVNFWGEGIAEEWVFGWTIETKKYMLDKSSEILNKNFTSYDREIEYQRMVEALMSYKSLLVVGEPGVGKNSLVSKFAYDSFSGKLKGNLYHQRLFQLMIDAFLAGAANQGDLEARLDTIIAELAHAGDVIIFIEDFENILGSSAYKLDLSAALIPYIEKGVIRIIATTTPGAFKKFVEPLHELLGVFEVIKLDELSQNDNTLMLFQKANFLEQTSGVAVTYRSVKAAVEYGTKYSRNLILPGAAVLLLKDTINSVALLGQGKRIVEEEDVLSQIQKETKAKVGQPKGEEKEILLHLEDEIHKRVVDQQEAVTAVSEAMRRLRSGLVDSQKPISFLFLGPTGVGKTETAKALSESYFGGEGEMIRFDMSEFSGDDATERLLGSEGLTDKIFENPSSLILLDEFEKANANVLNLFLQVLDDGRLTDNNGKTVSFLNSIIIATSNAASEFVREEVEKGTVLDKVFQAKLFDYLQTKGIFKPELLNRFDGVITFKPLNQNDLSQIVSLLLSELAKTMTEKDIDVSFDQTVVDKIVSEGFDNQFGARPMRRFIQDNIEDQIAQKILRDEIKRGDKILVSVDPNNKISFTTVN